MLPRKSEYSLFDDFFNDFNLQYPNRMMKSDLLENEQEYFLTIDLPGFCKEDIKISFQNGYIMIHAIAKKEENENEKSHYVKKERFFQECSRDFYVGTEIKEDKIKASYKNGVLQIRIPKKESAKTLSEQKYIQIED